MRVQNIQAVAITRLITIRTQPNSFVAVVVVDIVIRIKHRTGDTGPYTFMPMPGLATPCLRYKCVLTAFFS